MKIECFGKDGASQGEVECPDDRLHITNKIGAVRQTVIGQESNRRAGTASTKGVGDVSGSGKKLWKQKHTGRARVGQKRAPHWRTGGVAHGPHARSFRHLLNRKVRRKALLQALASRIRDGECRVVEGITQEQPKTKEMAAFLKGQGISGTCLLIIPARDENLWRSARNIEGVEIEEVRNLSAYQVLRVKKLVVWKPAFEQIVEMLPVTEGSAS